MKISKVFKYGSYVVLVFGFLYVSWHLGRSFEKTDSQETAVIACAEIDDLKRVYEEVLRELEEPTPKSHWNNKYMEFTKR